MSRGWFCSISSRAAACYTEERDCPRSHPTPRIEVGKSLARVIRRTAYVTSNDEERSRTFISRCR